MFEQLTHLASSLAAEDLAELPDARLEEDFAALQRVSERLELERLRRLAEIDRRGLHQRDGHLSSVGWLSATHRVPRASAAHQVRAARTFDAMPGVREAAREGSISLGAARLLAFAHRLDPEAFARSEATLVDAARIHAPHDLQRALGHWRELVLTKRSQDQLHAGRRLHASVTFGGIVRIDGDLDPETGESLLTALSAVMDAEARAEDDDPRTPAQRRVDALGEICRDWLDLADRPTVAGEKPHVTVTLDVEALVAGGTGQLDHAGAVASDALRRLACDASIVRVVMAGRSEPLDVGRRTPVVPPAMRRALIVRDRSCRFPGCERPHRWCDAHHVVHWADGGPTAVSNLVLLCRRHHRLIHEGFGVRMVGGGPVFARPDGTPLADRAPPALAA